jgi:uncharacterized protein YprB with RNaseH-like and TPR domain
MESLADKLRSLGVQKGAGNLKSLSQPEKTRFDISEVVSGYDLETPFGPAFVSEQDYPFSGLRPSPAEADPLAFIRQWAGFPSEIAHPIENYVFLDTETSGLTGGTGTFVFLIGLGYLTKNGFHMVQIFMREPGQETALLAGLSQYLAPFKTVVTFNGKSFDVPMLNTRHVLNGFTTPFNQLSHIDLLPLARRLWRNRLPSRALKDLEVEILGLARTQEEVPGWMVPELYFEYLRSGDARPLGGVFYHNAQDVVTLGKLLDHVVGLLANPLLVASDQGLDLIAVARLYEEMKLWDRAVELYERSLTSGLPLPFFLDTLRRYANLYRKQNRWEEAIQLWQKAVEYHRVDACIELAKCMEHQRRDYPAALQWAETAQGYVSEINELNIRKEMLSDLEHRTHRLRLKIQTATNAEPKG